MTANVRHIGAQVMDDLVAQAKASPRLRQHLNFHGSYAEPVQRFLNAVEPDSYVRPHRHQPGQGPETTYALTGKAACVTFADDGAVDGVFLMHPAGGSHGVEIAPGTWHMIVSLTSGTVLLEIKQGPYDPNAAKQFADWSPQDGSPEAADFQLFIGAAIRRSHPDGPDAPCC